MRHLAYVNGSNRCDRIADSVLVIPSPRFLARRGYDTDAIRRVVRTLVGELDS